MKTLHKTFTGYITKANLPLGGVFVFGSNTEGRHGLGNAKFARDNFGAIIGKASGMQGRSYGLITTDLASKKRGERYPHIQREIERFYDWAHMHTESEFYLAYTDKGPFLSGYTFDELLTFFTNRGLINIPGNVVFHEGFYKAMCNKALQRMITIATESPWVNRFISKFNGNIYVVGGSVRNFFLGVEIKDLDYVVTNVTVPQVMEFLNKECPNVSGQLVGEHFKVFKITTKFGVYDLALARTEISTGSGHSDFEVVTTNVTIEEDLKRRDFTVNTLAIDLKTKQLIDPYGGLVDLQTRRIRCVDKDEITLVEDPLRIIRMIRFMTIYDLNNQGIMFENYMNELVKDPTLINSISTERVLEELRKIPVDKYPKLLTLLLTVSPVLSNWKYQYDKLEPGESYGSDFKFTPTNPPLVTCFSQLLYEILKGRIHNSIYSAMPGLTSEEKIELKTHSVLSELLYRRKELDHQAVSLIERYPEVRFNPKYFELHTATLPTKKELLLTGDDLIENLGVKAGKEIGNIILLLQIAVAKQVVKNDRQDLMNYTRNILSYSARLKKN